MQLANFLALPILGRVGGTRFWDTSRMLRRNAKRTLAERQAEQLRLLNALLTRPARNVPLHRERIDGRAQSQAGTYQSRIPFGKWRCEAVSLPLKASRK
jgi:hypothetical protein